MLPDATQVVDACYVVRVAKGRLDGTRRCVQQNVLGHRSRKPTGIVLRRVPRLVQARHRCSGRPVNSEPPKHHESVPGLRGCPVQCSAVSEVVGRIPSLSLWKTRKVGACRSSTLRSGTATSLSSAPDASCDRKSRSSLRLSAVIVCLS